MRGSAKVRENVDERLHLVPSRPRALPAAAGSILSILSSAVAGLRLDFPLRDPSAVSASKGRKSSEHIHEQILGAAEAGGLLV